MTATNTLVRRRTAARRDAVERQRTLNEERDRRDAQELNLAADFALGSQDLDAARAAMHAAELALGRIVDTLIGELRIRYDRAAQLLGTSEEELRRLRQIATDAATSDPAAPTRRPTAARSGRRPRSRTPPPPTPTAEPVSREPAPDLPGDPADERPP